MEEAKKNLLTYAGLRKLEDELHDLKVVKRKEVAGKIKEAREQGDLSENAEYDAAKDEQRDIEARIEEIEKILKNAEVVVEKPKCTIYTNLACDGNMMTFPYLKQKYQIPGFYIDVPYEKNQDSISYVADQLRELKKFLEDVGGKKISEQSVQRAVANSNEAASYYSSQLALRKDHDPVTSLTNELYAIFMCHLLAGSEESLKYTKMLLEDVKKAPKGEGLHILWMHMMPFLQEPVKDVFNYSQNVHIRACDFVADGFQRMQASDPYEALAEKMVNCIYNGSVKQRIRRAQELANLTEADGGILFAHWGCKGTIGASSLIKNSLENAGLPTMVLDGDGCNPANSSDGQVSTRLQAYLEMLSEGKEEKRS